MMALLRALSLCSLEELLGPLPTSGFRDEHGRGQSA
jgi:hypothetical protein